MPFRLSAPPRRSISTHYGDERMTGLGKLFVSLNGRNVVRSGHSRDGSRCGGKRTFRFKQQNHESSHSNLAPIVPFLKSLHCVAVEVFHEPLVKSRLWRILADMAEHWIEAAQALEISGDRICLCTRLHAGLIAARARSMTIEGQTAHNATVPASFWWAKGHEAAEQDWASGDFSTWIDREKQVFVFGVTLALSAVLEIVAFENRALIARKLSVAGSTEWILAKDARRLAYDRFR